MSRIRVTPEATAEISLLRERLRVVETRLVKVIHAGNSLSVYAPANSVRMWNKAKETKP